MIQPQIENKAFLKKIGAYIEKDLNFDNLVGDNGGALDNNDPAENGAAGVRATEMGNGVNMQVLASGDAAKRK